MKPALSDERLLECGFAEVGCWELNSARDLVHTIDLPSRAGVYAFVINGVVQYVGLASKSLRQRLGFYRKPGASQPTNIRLNEIIRGQLGQGAIVQILIAHPSDGEWNGFRVSGAEGLEAGLIADFDLPWNMRGSPNQIAQLAIDPDDGRQSNVSVRVLELVMMRPGMTELEIAKAIYGPSAVQQQVNQVCRKLIELGKLERRGRGHSDPFTYFRDQHASVTEGGV